MEVIQAAFLNTQAPAALQREPYLLTISRWTESLTHQQATVRPGPVAGHLFLTFPGETPIILQPGHGPHEVVVRSRTVTCVTPHALYATEEIMDARLLTLDHHALLPLTHPIQQIYTELTGRSHAVTASRPLFSADLQISLYHLHGAHDAHWLVLEHQENTATMTSKWYELSA